MHDKTNIYDRAPIKFYALFGDIIRNGEHEQQQQQPRHALGHKMKNEDLFPEKSHRYNPNAPTQHKIIANKEEEEKKTFEGEQQTLHQTGYTQ